MCIHIYCTYAQHCCSFLDSCFQSIAIEVIVLSLIGAVLQNERFQLRGGQERDSMFAGSLLQVIFLVRTACYHAIMPSVVRIYIVEVCSILDKGDGMGGNLVCVELFPIIPNHIISYYKIPRMHFKSAARHF